MGFQESLRREDCQTIAGMIDFPAELSGKLYFTRSECRLLQLTFAICNLLEQMCERCNNRYYRNFTPSQVVQLSGPTEVYLHVVIDWGTKKLLSAHMSLTSKSSDWIAALNEAVNLQFPNGIRESIIIPELVRDHGCQPTSTAFFMACSELGIQQIFASYSNPKGNADTERVIRTLKEDLVWPREFDSVADFEKALNIWPKEYNEDYPHSSLGYMTPYEYERWFQASAA